MKRPKIFILGLDGASPELIACLRAEGRLPNISAMIKDGVFTKLETTVPSLSAVAWASFMTGMNPGRHGVFDGWDFEYQRDVSYRKMPLGAARIRSRANLLWDILCRHNLFPVVLEPMCIGPAYPLNGILEAGHSTVKTGPDQHAVWPPGMRDLYLKSAGASDFPAGCEIHPFRPGKFKRDADKTIYLIKNSGFDFFFVWLNWLDGVQHHWWRHEDASHPFHALAAAESHAGGEATKIITKYYELADTFIGNIRESLPPDTIFVIMSDHGFSAVHSYFYLNRLFYDHGLLKLRDGRAARRGVGVRRIRLRNLPGAGRLARSQRVVPYLSIGLADDAFIPALDPLYQPFETIDWRRTRAFAVTCGVRLNVKDREPAGTIDPGDDYSRLRDEIAELLRGRLDPRSGEPVCTVRYPEEVYDGPFTARAPDLIVSDVERTKVHIRPDLDCLPYRNQYEPALWLSGSHLGDQPGVMISAGPGIRHVSSAIDAHITDIAPTMLYLLGVPAPSDTDGKVLTDIIEPGTVKELGEPRTIDYPLISDERPADAAEEVDEETIRHLRGLGYIA
ncbi:MAG: alkaline phosphatase family protein [bacterium]